MPQLKAAEFRPIARELWGSFCEGFSEQHQGRMATVAEVDTAMLERRPLTAYAASLLIADDEPFQRLALDAAERPGCVVRVGARKEVEHSLPEVVGVYLHCNEEGAHRGVRIDAASNTSLIVNFRHPAIPDPHH